MLAITAIFAGCIDKDDVKLRDIAHLAPSVAKQVPIKDGYRTIITADGDTICSAVEAMLYMSPKGCEEKISYVPYSKGYEDEGVSVTNNQFFLCFEDTKNGDNDYNDFVCNMYLETSNKLPNSKGKASKKQGYVSVIVQPVAYGAGIQDLKFGIKFTDGTNVTTVILTENIKDTYFPNSQGFVNVLANQMASPYWTNDAQHIKTTVIGPISNYNQLSFSPFIINGTDTIYTVTSQRTGNLAYNDIISQKGYPYGLTILHNSTNQFNHALEKIKFSDVYHQFSSWLSGTGNHLSLTDRDESKIFTYATGFINTQLKKTKK